jgi:ubiquinone/menaquinone biosynthesis C-methylase UbiE
MEKVETMHDDVEKVKVAATIEDVRRYYDERHREKGERAWRAKEEYPVFLELLGVKPGRKLLDVGCGTGFLLREAADRGLDTYGIDISEEGVKIAKAVSPKSTICVARGEELPFKGGMFDYVCCLGALEHFLDMDRGLGEMHRVGSQTAEYCLLVPNADFILYKLGLKKGTEQVEINEKPLSLGRWMEKFHEHGFSVKKVYRDRRNFFQRDSSNPILRKITRSFSSLIWSTIPLSRTYQFIFILAKSPRE